jgi:homoserine kinase
MTLATRNSNFDLAVPASVANLGPGFDTLAVAVQLYLRLHVRVVNGQDQLRFRFIDCVLTGENLIERAFRAAARHFEASVPSVEIEVRSDIPMSSGLGSSAAATVAGLRLFESLTEPIDRSQLLELASAIEGHGDNVSAAIYGGLTAAHKLDDGRMRAVRMFWPESLSLVVVTPECSLPTAAARRVLPAMVSHEDATFNVQRVALLLYSLQAEDYTLLRESLKDRLHQQYRLGLVPGMKEILELNHPGFLGACLSGSGPSLVAFARGDTRELEEFLRLHYLENGIDCKVRALRVHQEDAIPQIAACVFSSNRQDPILKGMCPR